MVALASRWQKERMMTVELDYSRGIGDQRAKRTSQRRGRWRRIARGLVSAARMISSAIPRFSVLVASLAPFFSWW